MENDFCDVCTANSISGRISAHDDGCVDRLHSFSLLWIWRIRIGQVFFLENQDWVIIALFLRLEKGKLWTWTSTLLFWACRRRPKTRPHFCVRRMILVTTFWALGGSFVEPLSGFAADTILLVRHSSSSSANISGTIRPSETPDSETTRSTLLALDVPARCTYQGEKAGFSGFSRLPGSPGFLVCRGHPAGGKSTLIAEQIPVPAACASSSPHQHSFDLKDTDNIEPQKIVSSLPLSLRGHSDCMSTGNTSRFRIFALNSELGYIWIRQVLCVVVDQGTER